MLIKSYHELIRLRTFEERYEYLKLRGRVGEETFGALRYLNQILYHSRDWKPIRRDIIIRDNGWDLGIPDREILGRIIVHHINPLTIEDVERRADCVFDPDNLISTSHNTSEAIHYGDASLLIRLPQERCKGDTSLWTAY